MHDRSWGVFGVTDVVVVGAGMMGCAVARALSLDHNGLVVATGFNGLGVMVSPLAAARVRALVADEPSAIPLSWLDFDCFESTSEGVDLRTISSF